MSDTLDRPHCQQFQAGLAQRNVTLRAYIRISTAKERTRLKSRLAPRDNLKTPTGQRSSVPAGCRLQGEMRPLEDQEFVIKYKISCLCATTVSSKRNSLKKSSCPEDLTAQNRSTITDSNSQAITFDITSWQSVGTSGSPRVSF